MHILIFGIAVVGFWAGNELRTSTISGKVTGQETTYTVVVKVIGKSTWSIQEASQVQSNLFLLNPPLLVSKQSATFPHYWIWQSSFATRSSARSMPLLQTDVDWSSWKAMSLSVWFVATSIGSMTWNIECIVDLMTPKPLTASSLSASWDAQGRQHCSSPSDASSSQSVRPC